MALKTAPAVRQQMLIRKPVADVFRAFIDPAITTKFWFTKSSGKLEQGKSVRWEWEMYGASVDVKVQALEPNKRIRIEWGSGGVFTIVEWEFDARPDGTTLVKVANTGFKGDDDEQVAKALDGMGGFSFLLGAAKIFLEHGVEPRFVPDHYPDAHRK
ncbi:MAG: SRPBCC family protein [Myxococcaceae bacterium]